MYRHAPRLTVRFVVPIRIGAVFCQTSRDIISPISPEVVYRWKQNYLRGSNKGSLGTTKEWQYHTIPHSIHTKTMTTDVRTWQRQLNHVVSWNPMITFRPIQLNPLMFRYVSYHMVGGSLTSMNVKACFSGSFVWRGRFFVNGLSSI